MYITIECNSSNFYVSILYYYVFLKSNSTKPMYSYKKGTKQTLSRAFKDVVCFINHQGAAKLVK